MGCVYNSDRAENVHDYITTKANLDFVENDENLLCFGNHIGAPRFEGTGKSGQELWRGR